MKDQIQTFSPSTGPATTKWPDTYNIWIPNESHLRTFNKAVEPYQPGDLKQQKHGGRSLGIEAHKLQNVSPQSERRTKGPLLH